MKEKNLIIPTVIFSIALILASSIFSFAFFSSRIKYDTLFSIGSAKKRVFSDIAKWQSNFFVRVKQRELREGYQKLRESESKILSVFKEYGFNSKEINMSAAMIEDVYDYNNSSLGEKEYIIRQNISIETKNVKDIASISKEITQRILNEGIFFQAGNVQYYLTNLPEIRISLLSQALEDARKRASEIAQAGKLKIIRLKEARSGIVQVLEPNSVEISDYGAYDVSSLEKEVMVTVHATFLVKPE